MKILKNKKRLHCVINELREDIRALYAVNESLNTDLHYAHREISHIQEELAELRVESIELLNIKERHYKLLKVIDITDAVKKVLGDK